MNQASIVGKIINFAAIQPDALPPSLQNAITSAREHVVLLVAPLSARRSAVLADANLSDTGRDGLMSQALTKTLLDVHGALDVPMKLAQRSLDDATRRLHQQMFDGIDVPGATTQPLAELLALATRGDFDPAKLPIDSDGGVLLSAGGPLHKLLHNVLTNQPLPAAKLAALSIVRASPFLAEMFGGEAVKQTVLKALEARMVKEDPASANVALERDSYDRALRILKGDRSSAQRAAHIAALGTPPPVHARSAS